MRHVAGYSLVGHEPIAFDDVIEWAQAWGMLCERGGHIVAQDYVGATLVSTVFIGLDYSFGTGPPLLWETMTFDVEANVQDRYSTWEAAAAGHRKTVAWLQANLVDATN